MKALKFLSLFLLLVFISGMTYSQFPARPPADVTRAMDRNQMLWQLGISLPEHPPRDKDPNAPLGAYPTNPDNPEANWTNEGRHTITRSSFGLWNNYDDFSSGFFPGPDSVKTGYYTGINLLKMNENDHVITTANEWWELRRHEVMRDVQNEVWGVVPHDSILPSVTWHVVTTTGGTGSSAYIQKEIVGTIDISRYPEVRESPRIVATMRLPATAAGPVPVMVGFGGNVNRIYDIVSAHGWGACSFDPGAIQPDNGTGLTSYLIGLVNKGNWRKPSDWGSLAAWSWGIGKLIDYFETDAMVDETRIGLTGHSRYGKATLVAMAYNERLFIAFPSDAGSLGTKMNRRHWGQDLENSGGESEYHWTAGNFFKWMGPLYEDSYMPRRVEIMPVDAHSLLSLCAPRPVFINGGNQSSWCDPYGMFLTTVEATPVYELLGAKGMIMNDVKPQIDVAYIEGDLGYRYHTGGHTDAPDWPAFMQFASKYVKAPALFISQPTLLLDNRADSETEFIVTSNTTWRIESSEEWLGISHSGGANDQLVSVWAKRRNRSNSARSARIVISASGLKDQYIYVNQTSRNPEINLSHNSLSLDAGDKTTVAFNIIANSAWSVSTDQPWLMVAPSGGINDGMVALVSQANAAVSEREALVTINSPGLEQSVVRVKQAGGPPTLSISSSSFIPDPELLELGSEEGSTVLVIANSNSDINTLVSVPWIKAEVAAMFGSSKRITLIAEENTSTSPRQAILTISVEGLPPRQINITQSAFGMDD